MNILPYPLAYEFGISSDALPDLDACHAYPHKNLYRDTSDQTELRLTMQVHMQQIARNTSECVEIVMLEKLDCILSKSATRPYIYEYKCECVRTHLCIDPSGRQQSPVIRESSPAIRWQRPIMQ
jgi:hypothetical protein